MDLKRLFNKGKRIVDQRGGVDSLKEDAAELKDIAKGKGSLTDNAKDAAAAIKDPGAPGGEEKAGPAGKQEHQGQAQDRPDQPGEGQGQSQP
jgi:hypothetical protein